jgi:hypothetical protein
MQGKAVDVIVHVDIDEVAVVIRRSLLYRILSTARGIRIAIQVIFHWSAHGLVVHQMAIVVAHIVIIVGCVIAEIAWRRHRN